MKKISKIDIINIEIYLIIDREKGLSGMISSKRKFSELSEEEKLIFVEAYLEGMSGINENGIQAKDLEWLRRHIPACDVTKDDNYIFISYSHRDFQQVYHDLAFFCYNSEKRVRFWYDEGLPAGDDWAAAVSENLNRPNCIGVIFYLSENFLRSAAVRQEIELVQSLGKPYLTVALEENKFSAEAILTNETDDELLSYVKDVFPNNVTSLPYTSEYEDILYRINKIEERFSVVTNVFSDFICEKTEDGLRLTEYKGHQTEIYIPERIGADPIVEISAIFDNAEKIYIPSTVKRIIPWIPEHDTYEDMERGEMENVSLARLAEWSIGGYRSPGCVLTCAQNLRQIEVDPLNPVYYDTEGVLFSRNHTLVRMPPNHEWKDEYFNEIEVIGVSAFAGYQNNDATIKFPSSLKKIEDHAFFESTVFYLDFQEGLKEIGVAAFESFGGCQLVPFILPSGVEHIGEWAFRNCTCPFLWGISVKEIPRGCFFGFAGESIFLCESVEKIGIGAFALCKIESLKLPDHLKIIEKDAFYLCEKIYSLTLPESLEYISISAFEGCEILKQIHYKGSILKLMQVQMDPEVSQEELLNFFSLIVTKTQWIKRLKSWIQSKRRSHIIKQYEALFEQKNASTSEETQEESDEENTEA